VSRLLISFSGGRTSAYMAKRLLDLVRAKANPPEVAIVFANTGQEDERTLEFVDRCDKTFGFGVVWVEAHVNAGKKGCTARVVDYASASRAGEPFEAVIGKYGIPNPSYPHCTRELKMNPIKDYVRGLGWKAGSYDLAIGIRVDEIDRMRADAQQERIIYPLVKWGVRKQDVVSWWQRQPFDLEIPEHRGNCVTCWKKSYRKLLTIARDDPGAFAFFDRMEREYPHAGAGEGPRTFFRKNMTARDILAASAMPFDAFVDRNGEQMEMDLGGGCGESCEVFTDAA
jgi:hypothetical protein